MDIFQDGTFEFLDGAKSRERDALEKLKVYAVKRANKGARSLVSDVVMNDKYAAANNTLCQFSFSPADTTPFDLRLVQQDDEIMKIIQEQGATERVPPKKAEVADFYCRVDFEIQFFGENETRRGVERRR